jgi:hypothetical protein
MPAGDSKAIQQALKLAIAELLAELSLQPRSLRVTSYEVLLRELRERLIDNP